MSNPYRDKLLSIGVIGRRSGDRVVEGRRPDGVRVKATTDELNTTVTEHADDRQDVLIRPETVRLPRDLVPRELIRKDGPHAGA